MRRESYARGFCKAAEAAGVDPQALAKYAAQNAAMQAKTNADITALENQAKTEMNKTPPPGVGRTAMFAPKMQQIIKRLEAAKGKRVKGFDGSRFQYVN